jgi:hypothetical protein
VAVAGSAALALLSLALPAAAQVVIVPGQAVQGEAANLMFRVSNDSATASITRIEMRLPDDAPIAEVYPLSVDNWTPSITMRTLDKPVPSLHGGSSLTEATAAVTWTAVPGKELAPGGTTELTLSVGPLPNADRFVVGVVVTNSDGSTMRWTRQPAPAGSAEQNGAAANGAAAPAAGEGPAPVLTLQTPTGDQAQADHAAHGATAPAAAPAAPAGQSGPAYGGWVLVTLLFIAALTTFSLVRQRRGTTRTPEPEPDDPDPEAGAETGSKKLPEMATTSRSGRAP